MNVFFFRKFPFSDMTGTSGYFSITSKSWKKMIFLQSQKVYKSIEKVNYKTFLNIFSNFFAAVFFTLALLLSWESENMILHQENVCSNKGHWDPHPEGKRKTAISFEFPS